MAQPGLTALQVQPGPRARPARSGLMEAKDLLGSRASKVRMVFSYQDHRARPVQQAQLGQQAQREHKAHRENQEPRVLKALLVKTVFGYQDHKVKQVLLAQPVPQGPLVQLEHRAQ